MSPKLPDALTVFVRQRANFRCEYCQTSEALSGQACQIDHIVPRSLNGLSQENNLCLACVDCNRYKLSQTTTLDPQSGEIVPLFNPRAQIWNEHFEWSEDGIKINGITNIGRATVIALRMNRPIVVAARAAWSSIGRHPPHKT